MLSGKLSVGDELILLHDKKKMIKHKIERIEIQHKSVKGAKKGQDIGIKIPNATKAYKIYRVVKNK